jgi:hypothetical protein
VEFAVQLGVVTRIKKEIMDGLSFAHLATRSFLHMRRREILTLGEGFNTEVIIFTPWCFYIVGREILTLGEGFNTQVITLWCFYIVGREILTLGEGFNTQVITLWCFYIVGREILTLGEGFNTQVITLWCFYIVGRGRAPCSCSSPPCSPPNTPTSNPLLPGGPVISHLATEIHRRALGTSCQCDCLV